MYLRKLSLFNFKNYEEGHYSFDNKVNCFLGKNGVGKTNILDAIYYLGFTKSFLSSSDSLHIRHGESNFVVRGQFEINNDLQEVACSYSNSSKKIIRVGEDEADKLSNHIGKFPMVLIAPNDIELIWGSGDLRRRFFDSLISQIDKTYLENLIAYNHQLRQRNSLLRLAGHSQIDFDLLYTYDQKLTEAGTYIHLKRAEFLNTYLPLFEKHYAFLCGESGEEVNVSYRSDCAGADLNELLKQNVNRDIALQRTSVGIHRDDFIFMLGDYELRKIGSQGQQKSFLIAMKLAEFQSIELAKRAKPLLLLDDIFDKLDDERIHKLVSLVVDDTFGQLFITDARPDRSQGLLKEAGVGAELFMIEKGNLTEVI